jgi:hypothetical protein
MDVIKDNQREQPSRRKGTAAFVEQQKSKNMTRINYD